jgi:hypothetical protein
VSYSNRQTDAINEMIGGISAAEQLQHIGRWLEERAILQSSFALVREWMKRG